MKTRISPGTGEQGTTLLVALFLTTILAVTIAGYLRHAYQQHYLSMRSQVWNTSMATTEAGIEEALQHLNANPTNLSANGWVKSGSLYTMTRDLTPKARYVVTIDAANLEKPEISSVAYVNPPSMGGLGSGPLAFFAAALSPGYTDPSSTEAKVRRAVVVKAGRTSLYAKAMVAKYTIDMNGNNVTTDSFDSSDPDHSDNGMYPTNSSKRMSNGDVASNHTVQNSITVGNANIYGKVAVGPGGTVSVGSQGGVGERWWVAANPGKIQAGYFSDDMNFTFPTVELPAAFGSTPLPQNYTVYTTNWVFSSSTNMVTTTTYPSPAPLSGVVSNISYQTVSALPSPTPYGAVTNVLTENQKSKTFPAAGTYKGTPTKTGSWWYFDRITGTNYTYPYYTYTYGVGTTTTNYTVTSKTYDYVIEGSSGTMPPQTYTLNALSNAKVLVKGNVNLIVLGDVKQSGQNGIWVDTDGKLQMWVGGTSCDLSGQGVFNDNGYAQNFMLFCTDSVTSLTLAGNGEFTGVIVAPNAAVRLNGGGSDPEDFIGSLIAKTIVLNGHYKFHYDEALKSLIGNSRYKVQEWNEISIALVN